MANESLLNKKILILGVANERSIAWAVAQKFAAEGAKIALSYPNEAILKRVEPLAKEISAEFVFPFDASNEDDYQKLKQHIQFEQIDGLVHSMAFANKDDLSNPFLQVSQKGFRQCLEISSYSLIGLCRELYPLFSNQASVMAMTYYGSQKIIPGYHLMGVAKAALECSIRYLALELGEQKQIRVNGLSAGPIRTLAASGVSGFKEKLKQAEEKSILKENVTQDEVAATALYLASSLSQKVTGQILYVDSGLSSLGV